MLIRKPANPVFINPEITAKFWFTKSSGPLEAGYKIRWEWEMYGVGTEVVFKPSNLTVASSSPGNDSGTDTVEWLFEPRGANAIQVTITNSSFSGTDEEMGARAIGSTEGFTFVLSGLKVYLEHSIQLNLVADKAPEARVESWKAN